MGLEIIKEKHTVMAKIHPDTLQFFDELYVNNNREWFADNKHRWEAIQEQFLAFTQELLDAMQPLDPTLRNCEAKKCVYRIYRDLRFSKDKRPYKTHIACFLASGGDRTKCVPGYYFQLGRQDEYDLHGNCTMGGGVWGPSPKALDAIRQEILYNPEEFGEIVTAEEYRRFFGTDFYTTKHLSRTPKGYPSDWEHSEWFKTKDYVSMWEVPQQLVFGDDLIERVIGAMKATVPLNRFLQRAMWEEMGR